MEEECDQERPPSPTKITPNSSVIHVDQASGRPGVPGTGNAIVQRALRSPCRLCYRGGRKCKKLPFRRTNRFSMGASTTTTDFSCTTTDSNRLYRSGYPLPYGNRFQKRRMTQNGTRDQKIKIKLQIIFPAVNAKKTEIFPGAGLERSSKTRRALREHYRSSLTGYGKEARSFKLFMGSALLLGLLTGAGLGLWGLSRKNDRKRLQSSARAASPMLALPDTVEYSDPAAPARPMLEHPSPCRTSAPTTEVLSPEPVQFSERAISPSRVSPLSTLSSTPLPSKDQVSRRRISSSLSDGAPQPDIEPPPPSSLIRPVSVDDMPTDDQQKVLETVGGQQEVYERALSAQEITEKQISVEQDTESLRPQGSPSSPFSSVQSQASWCPRSSPSEGQYHTPPPGVPSPSPKIPEDWIFRKESLARWLRDVNSIASADTADEGSNADGSTNFTWTNEG